MKKILQKIFILLPAATLSVLSAKADFDTHSSGKTITGWYVGTAPALDGEFNETAWTAGDVTGTNVYSTGTNVFLPNNASNNVDQKINVNCSDNTSACVAAPSSSLYTAEVSLAVRFDLDYLYLGFIVKDPTSLAALNSAGTSGALGPYYSGMEVYINSDVTQSSLLPPEKNWPRGYNNSVDAQIALNAKNLAATFLSGKNGLVVAGGMTFGSSDVEGVMKVTSDGYNMEVRISWLSINQSFIDGLTGAYTDATKAPKAGRTFGVDFGINIPDPNASLNKRQAVKMWNQCCSNRNWTESKNFGRITLAGNVPLATTTSTVTIIGPETVSSTNLLKYFSQSLPEGASNKVQWSIIDPSVAGGNLTALISETGEFTPISNGVVTIVAKSLNPLNDQNNLPKGYKVVTISNIITATDLTIIQGGSINADKMFGTSNFLGSVKNGVSIIGVPQKVKWKLITDPADAFPPAAIDEITGVLQATCLYSEAKAVTVMGISLNNPAVSTTKKVFVECPAALTSDLVTIDAANFKVSCTTPTKTSLVGFDRAVAGKNITNIYSTIKYPRIDPNSDPLKPFQILTTVSGVFRDSVENVSISTTLFPLSVSGTTAAVKLTADGAGGNHVINFKQNTGLVTLTGSYLYYPALKQYLVANINSIGDVDCKCNCPDPTDELEIRTILKPCGPLLGTDDPANTYCTVTGISSFSDHGQLSIYPNPSSSEVTIKVADGSSLQNATLTVQEATGTLVYSNNISLIGGTDALLNVNHLPSGIYTLSLQLQNGRTHHAKIVVIK